MIPYGRFGKMGWFSADEVVAPVINSKSEQNHTAQTVAICVIAALAVSYIAVKFISKLLRQQTERVASRTFQMNNLATTA